MLISRHQRSVMSRKFPIWGRLYRLRTLIFPAHTSLNGIWSLNAEPHGTSRKAIKMREHWRKKRGKNSLKPQRNQIYISNIQVKPHEISVQMSKTKRPKIRKMGWNSTEMGRKLTKITCKNDHASKESQKFRPRSGKKATFRYLLSTRRCPSAL